MTRVCLIGSPDTNLAYELLSRETARAALSTYDLREPFENALALDTVSIGAAVSLLNDLDWYLARFVTEALVLEPSVDPEEWLSRALAEAVRNGEVDPAETGDRLKVYGVDDGRLAEPVFVARDGDGAEADPDADPTDGYDRRDVEGTLAVRVTDAEFEG